MGAAPGAAGPFHTVTAADPGGAACPTAGSVLLALVREELFSGCASFPHENIFR